MIYKHVALTLSLIVASVAAACVVREPGTEVEVAVVGLASGTGPAEIASDRGYRVALGELYVVVSKVELVPCASADASRDLSVAALLRSLVRPATAYAHGVNTPTSWAAPQVLAPMQDGASVSLALLHPPATQYCSLRVTLGAADNDAERMPEEPSMLGLSMYIAGYFGADGGTPQVSFRYKSDISAVSELALTDAAGEPTVLTLSEDNLRGTIRLNLGYTQWFDGLALFPGAFGTFGDVVLAQALERATANVEN